MILAELRESPVLRQDVADLKAPPKPILFGESYPVSFSKVQGKQGQDLFESPEMELAEVGTCRFRLVSANDHPAHPQDDDVILERHGEQIIQRDLKEKQIFGGNNDQCYIPDVEINIDFDDRDGQNRNIMCIVSIGEISYIGQNQLLRDGMPRNFAFFDQWKTREGRSVRPNISEDLNDRITIRFEELPEQKPSNGFLPAFK